MDKNKLTALALGDYSNAPYHPFRDIDGLLLDLLAGKFHLTCTEEREILEPQKLSGYNLFITYTDSWDRKLTGSQVSALLSFVALGGGLLILHSGISLQNNPEFAQMAGARFTGHPPYQKLSYRTVDKSHPITAGIDTFEMDEELYMFDFDNLAEPEILMDSGNSEQSSPALWVRQYGQGRVVYLAPGHDIKSFRNTVFQKLIYNSALWAAKLA